MDLIALGVALILIPFVTVILLWIMFGREPDSGHGAHYEHGPPRNVPLAAIPVILHPKVRQEAHHRLVLDGMLATVIDLVRRRVITMEESGDSANRVVAFALKEPKRLEALDPLTRATAEFFFREMSGGEPILTDGQMSDFFRKADPTWLRAYLDHFADQATEWWKRELNVRFLVKPVVSRLSRFVLSSVGLLFAGLMLLNAGIGLRAPKPLFPPREIFWPWREIEIDDAGTTVAVAVGAFIALIALGRLFLLLVQPLRRWNRVALVEHQRWHAFRRFLTDFTALKRAPIELFPIWEEYYVYALALGVTQDFKNHLGALVIERGIELPQTLEQVATFEFARSWIEALEEQRSKAAKKK
jgi:hypothetical protein